MHEQRRELKKKISHTSNVFDVQITEELKKFSHTSDVSDAKLGNELKKNILLAVKNNFASVTAPKDCH